MKTQTPENHSKWLQSGLKVDPKTAQGLQNLSKFTQNGYKIDQKSMKFQISWKMKNIKKT